MMSSSTRSEGNGERWEGRGRGSCMGDCGACIVITMVLIARDVSMGLLLVMAYVPRFFENTETSQTYVSQQRASLCLPNWQQYT